MPRAACLAYDTKDDRRELHQLLCRLPPAARLNFLAWCCRRACLPNSQVRPKVGKGMPAKVPLANKDDSADEKLSLEVFLDVWNLALQYELNLTEATAELVRRVRRA